MFSRLISALVFISVCFSPPIFTAPNVVDSFKPGDIINRDVAIIGGGSAGTYSAISLKDKGKSVIVIEEKGRLGGHTETYIDPVTGTPIDMGVILFHNTTLVTDYFKRFGIPLSVSQFDASSADYDFRTGKQVNVTIPTAAEVGAALASYTAQLIKYPGLDNGMYLPDPVPDDLVMPFGEFAKKYNIEAAIPTMFQYNPGLGDILTVPTVEQMRLFGLSLVQQLSTGLLSTVHHNNSQLYTKATTELVSASSLLLSSKVEQATRRSGSKGIELIVRTPIGKKLIHAKRLLITIPPRLDFLQPFDLSSREKNVFGKFIDAGYYTSILKNTGIPSNLLVRNRRQSTPFNLPVLPGAYHIDPTPISGLNLAYYGSPRSAQAYPLSDAAVKADIIASIKKLQLANPDQFTQTEPEFVEYSSHTPFYLQACPEETKTGFYKRLYSLQGERNTYWTGATWRAQDSSSIWRFSETEVLPKVLEGL